MSFATNTRRKILIQIIGFIRELVAFIFRHEFTNRIFDSLLCVFESSSTDPAGGKTSLLKT